MKKNTLIIVLLASALGAGGVAFAKGPGGGQGPSHMSEQGLSNSNAQSAPDAVKGQVRAAERAQNQEQVRERVQDGSGAQHEHRVQTQKRREVKTQNAAKTQQKTQTKVQQKSQPEAPLQTQEQIREQSREQLRVNPQ